MKAIYTSGAPAPAGHYAQGIVHNGLLYVSGQLPINPETGDKSVTSIEAQTQQVLANLEAVLLESGSGKDQVLKVTIYVADMALWDRVNAVYAEFFGDHKPARAVVPTLELHFGFQIEMDALAVVND